jgi:hypothetical protein
MPYIFMVFRQVPCHYAVIFISCRGICESFIWSLQLSQPMDWILQKGRVITTGSANMASQRTA